MKVLQDARENLICLKTQPPVLICIYSELYWQLVFEILEHLTYVLVVRLQNLVRALL